MTYGLTEDEIDQVLTTFLRELESELNTQSKSAQPTLDMIASSIGIVNGVILRFIKEIIKKNNSRWEAQLREAGLSDGGNASGFGGSDA